MLGDVLRKKNHIRNKTIDSKRTKNNAKLKSK